jgi:ATP-dependent RNA circularization protein (DNA/RNA ligase family)
MKVNGRRLERGLKIQIFRMLNVLLSDAMSFRVKKSIVEKKLCGFNLFVVEMAGNELDAFWDIGSLVIF